MTELILSIVALLIFIVYNSVAIGIFGIPPSLSDTYYLYEKKKLNLGWIFTGMMWTIALLLMPAWLSITQNISEWSSYLTVLPFLGAGAIAFVGTAPRFKPYNQMENKVHVISALCAAVFSLLWVAIVCWKISWIIPIWVLLMGGVAHLTKTAKKCRDYWLEMVAFGSTFTAIITECILRVL